MESLRWILLVVGAVVLLGVFLWSRRPRPARRRDSAEEPAEQDRPLARDADIDLGGLEDELSRLEAMITAESDEPMLETLRADSAAASDPPPERARAATGPASETGASPRNAEEKIIVLYVVASEGLAFPGVSLYQAFAAQGLRFGAMNIFHRLPEAGGEAVFSVANMVEPGTFKPDSSDYFSTPGITLFMRLPGPMAAEAVLENMLSTAQRLAETLDGQVLDSARSTLSKQAAAHLREEVQAWQRRNRIPVRA